MPVSPWTCRKCGDKIERKSPLDQRRSCGRCFPEVPTCQMCGCGVARKTPFSRPRYCEGCAEIADRMVNARWQAKTYYAGRHPHA